MRDTAKIKDYPRQDVEEDIKEMVCYAYGAFDSTPSKQSIDMSVNAILDAITSNMTFLDVKEIINRALDDPENRKVYPKWFGDVIRNSRGNQVNRHYDDDIFSAYHSSGDDETDMALNFMSMIATAILWSPDDLIRCGTSSDAKMHAWLVRCGIIKEQSGDMEQWRQRARASFLDDDGRRINKFSDICRQNLEQGRNVDNRAYMLWRNSVICNIVDWFSKGKGIDDVNALISRATGKQVRIMLDDTPAGFHCEYNNGNGWQTTEY